MKLLTMSFVRPQYLIELPNAAYMSLEAYAHSTKRVYDDMKHMRSLHYHESLNRVAQQLSIRSQNNVCKV